MSAGFGEANRDARRGRRSGAMRVRGRLMLAFGYLLLVVIVALEVPLAVNLRNRSLAEQRAQETTLAVATAAQARSLLSPPDRGALQNQVRAQAAANRSRVIVVDRHGRLIADSSGPDLLGTDYASVDRPEILGALADGQVSFRIGFSDTLRQQIPAVAAPVTGVDRATGDPVTVGAVRVTQTTDQISASVRRSVVGLVAIGVGVLAAGLLVAFVLAGSVSRPLRRLAGTAAELGGGRLDARAGDVRGPREVEEVAGSFDEMAARLEATVRAQREFTANASHQLRTPLTGLKLRLETALEEAPEDATDLRRQLEAADREADRLASIVERLLVLARRVEEGQALAVVDLSEAALGARERFGEKAAGRAIEVRSPATGAHALADRADVDQMLDALVDNALAYAPGRVVIETARADGQAVIAVEDEGPGIPEDEVDRVSERFFRGRSAPAGGSGLGLAIVRDLAERAGGEMVVVAGRKRGARIEVRLPGAGGSDG